MRQLEVSEGPPLGSLEGSLRCFVLFCFFMSLLSFSSAKEILSVCMSGRHVDNPGFIPLLPRR